jgi:hypothetical protein
LGSGDLEARVSVSVRQGALEPDGGERAESIRSSRPQSSRASALSRASSSALSEWSESFLRSCGRDPEEVRLLAADAVRGRCEELVVQICRPRDGRRIPADRTLIGNHELLVTTPPGASAGELRARIAMVTRQIQSVTSEIDWLQAEIERQRQGWIPEESDDTM